MTPQSIITLARDPLNDTNAVTPRQSNAELVRAVNAGIKEISILLPALFTRIRTYTTVLGVKQALDFSEDQALVDVLRITNGAALTQFDRRALDAFEPTWTTRTAGVVQQWSPIDGDPLGFLTYPPATAAQSLDVQSVRVPTEYALADEITELPGSFEPALAHFVIAFAETKDDEHVNSGRVSANYAAFIALVKPGEPKA